MCKASKYHLLKEGEIVRPLDEFYDDDAKKWKRVVNSVGKPVSSPCYTSHLLFRRRLKED